MAEARSEEEEENMRESREQVVRRQPRTSGGRSERRKPEHRHSQGPLSSIRAAIKRTSTRSTSLSETSNTRERDRDRERERRRPEITILSAEPLASTSWFPGASGGFPPPPPPAAQIWGPTIPPSIQPPPSYEEVIREKTQEQDLLPDPQDPQVSRPSRPPRPSPLSNPPKSSHVDDITTTASQSTPTSLNSDCVGTNTEPETVPHASALTQCCNVLPQLGSPLTSTTCAQTDQRDQAFAAVDSPPSASSQVLLERPRPRPRSKLGVQRISRSEVKVQTLVKLREDGCATLAARAQADSTNPEVSQGKYLQELLDAFSSDDWGFPDQHSDSSEHSRSESEDEDEDEDMAALKARIQAFEQQQQQQVADGSCGETNDGDFVVTKKPEPRPRPRLQPAKSAPPTVAPKPKNFSHSSKPSSKVFWEDVCLTAESVAQETLESLSEESNAETPTPPESAPCVLKPAAAPSKPSVAPKPQPASETPPSSNLSSPASAPVPAPRPPPPKLTASLGEAPNPKPPPRPPVAPRACVGQHNRTRATQLGRASRLFPRDPRGGQRWSTGRASGRGDAGRCKTNCESRKCSSRRPDQTGSTDLPPQSQRSKSGSQTYWNFTNASRSKPGLIQICSCSGSGPQNHQDQRPPSPHPVPAKPPVTAPAPSLRKSPVIQQKAESTRAANPSDPPLPRRPSGEKLLPLRPPPIKSTPGRPPPPAVNSTSSANQIPPSSRASPALSVSPAAQSSQTTPPPVTANKLPAQRVSKRGPPLPPRPKPGHPLYTSYTKQEVLIVLDDPLPSERLPDEGVGQTSVVPLINPSQCLLDLDTQPEPVPDQDGQSKPALEDVSLSESQSILPVQPPEQKDQPDPLPSGDPVLICPAFPSGPRCVALFDYEGEEGDELTFSQGDVIALLELKGPEWGRGQIHGRIGIFPLSFTEVVEPLPQTPTSLEETSKATAMDTTVKENNEPKTSQDSNSEVSVLRWREVEEWAVALFDFPGQTEEDLSFHKGALIRVIKHIDTEWRRGRLEGREGLYPAAFTQLHQVQPIPDQQSVVKGAGKALFDFTAESEDELTLKAGDDITQVEFVDEQWILGVVGGRRGLFPKNYISFL
ncbi:unnamed protein product [Pleuronectes platessa]|uniref:SH3 domain-containing protein n=1 Tax=Pleuronectes platessa TaxID=8262 RepID=A0A9N7V001_PLEPL|nr:unnamed protein product [Pleuronectes platessa]